MNRPITLVACACALLCCAQAFGTSWNTVVFRDDFDSSIGGMPDPCCWVVNNPESWWWTLGRTHFPCPPDPPDPWPMDGTLPRVEGGVCIIEHHLYNPYDLGSPNEWFLGGEIHTVLEFEANRSYRFEARVRLRSDLPPPYVPFPDGLVTSFFTYGYDGFNSDEIDIEFLSNLMNDDVGYPDGDPVLTNAWNESHQCPEYSAPEGLDLTEWNTFRIYWYPDAIPPRVEWTWLDPVNGETPLRTETDVSCVPDEPMALYFNFWAPCYTSWGHGCNPWDYAADPNLQPVDDVNANEICAYEIDYVEVRVPAKPQPAWYVDRVMCQSYGDCCNPNEYCLYSPASRVLGPPDWSKYASVPGEWWNGSPGEGGEFVVKFTGVLVTDEPGNDVRFWQGNGGGGETSQVRVSLDGVSFTDLCVLDDDIHSGGDPSPTSDGYYFDCDLSATGLSAIRYVKVVDVETDDDGSDIDAIEALSCTIPSAATGTLPRRQPVEAKTTR